ncbi:hypothetical protein [Streptomyces sp. AC495_CC817]|uniref:hypothetical protein n=1 Tax=Streptomyces sp. AC495_CC817 TaxID=2823900 RepID=UPI001C27F246|nr:hypothetical protein [Streptomyces sp. AC495_CC817]
MDLRIRREVCFTGMLSVQWSFPDTCSMDWLPNGVRLAAYAGEATDLSRESLQGFLGQAHRDMEAGVVGGKSVPLP